jgi:hypothetical protein
MPVDQAAIAAARDAGSRPARGRRYLLMFLACCLILCCLIVITGVLVVVNPPNSALAAWVGGTIAVATVGSLSGAIASFVVFVKTLSQRRRRRVRQVAWALVPIVSLTFLAWLPFAVLAFIRLRLRDWAVFAAYLAVVIAEIVLIALNAHGNDAAGIAADAMMLFLALAAPIHTLVAFRPAAGLPRWSDAERARATPGRHQPVINAADGGPATIPAGSFARPAMIFFTVATCGIAIALPAKFRWAHLPVRARCRLPGPGRRRADLGVFP